MSFGADLKPHFGIEMNYRLSSLVMVVLSSCAALLLVVFLGYLLGAMRTQTEGSQNEEGGLGSTATLSSATPLYAVSIRSPSGPPRLKLSSADPQGRQGEVACTTCHSVREPQFQNTADELDQFHQGLAVVHGKLACYGCHAPNDMDVLRLADGTPVEYKDVMTLCSQCHGTQATAYAHGAHGGMNGYWDLSRGPQVKNNCIDCHDPHWPAFPKMIVGFKPKDRFDYPLGEGPHDEESHERH